MNYETLTSGSGHVYFAKKWELVKIGCTNGDPKKRVRSLRSSHPVDVRAVLLHVVKTDNVMRAEHDFHEYFADKRIIGKHNCLTEWFLLTDEDIEIIRKIGEIHYEQG